MYNIYVKPLGYPNNIYLGYCYFKSIDEIADSIRCKLYKPDTNAMPSSIIDRYDTRYFKVSVIDNYNDSKEVASAIYDVQEDTFIEGTIKTI